jgi:Rieske Fe-S protein
MDTTRRTFLGVLWTAILAGLGVLLRTGEAGAKKVAIDLEKLSGLKEVGGSAVVSLKKRKILFIRSSEDVLSALEPVCTHQQCAVQYKKSWGEIRCACHGSTFSTTGKVTKGPADKGLKAFPASIQDGKVVVEI